MPWFLKTISIPIASLIALAATPALAQASKTQSETTVADDESYLQFGLGIDYSEGRYADLTDTKVTSIPASMKYLNGDFSVRVSLPYVWVEGPGSLITSPDSGGGGGRTDNSGPGSANSGRGGSRSSGDTVIVPGGTTRKANGIGDVNIALNYSFDLGSGFYFDATGKAKLPTASKTKRLGTGKADFTIAGALTKEIGSASLYVEGRRRFAGSTAASPLRDVWGVSTGLSARVAEGVRIGADYDWQQSAVRGNKASSEVTGWASFRLNKQVRLQIYGSTGFNSSSVDTAGGISLTYRFYGL